MSCTALLSNSTSQTTSDLQPAWLDYAKQKLKISQSRSCLTAIPSNYKSLYLQAKGKIAHEIARAHLSRNLQFPSSAISSLSAQVFSIFFCPSSKLLLGGNFSRISVRKVASKARGHGGEHPAAGKLTPNQLV